MYVDKTNNRVGILNGQPSYTLDVTGSIRATSTITATLGVLSNGVFLTSDSNVKENIVSADLTLCYSNVKNIPLRRFNYIPSYADGRIDKTQIGFIAQELSNYFPKSLVGLADDTFGTVYHINYDQAFMAHFGTTQLIMSTVEGRSSQIQNLTSTYLALTAQVSTVVGNNA
jgi:hypothetical protein